MVQQRHRYEIADTPESLSFINQDIQNDLLFVHRLRRRSSIKPTLGRRLMLAGSFKIISRSIFILL